MENLEKMNDQVMETVAGGVTADGWATVCGLETGYLALRTRPVYDYGNEIRGSESYNGDRLQITGGWATGTDNRRYVWVFNPRSGMSGWVNAAYLR